MFGDLTLTQFTGWQPSLARVFLFFVAILALHALVNVYSHRLISLLQNISVWWHVAGAAVIVAILLLLPERHQSFSFVFTETINNSGFGEGDGGLPFWFYVLPLGFLLTQYTITGFDACAHVSEETKGAAHSAARGLWQSIFYSAVGGWIVLLALLFAATDVAAVNRGGGQVVAILNSALDLAPATLILGISTIGQFFCGMSCVTSMSRMTYAFARDGAVPGWRLWSRVDRNRTPVFAILGGCLAALVITLPALYAPPGSLTPVAFLAVVSIAVIGLYLAFLIPIWLRWRMGDAFVPGPWTLGSKYRVLNLVAVVEIVVISVYFVMPVSPQGVPFSAEFDWTAVNYSPIAVGVVLLGISLWWRLSARTWFTGPRRTVDEEPATPPRRR